MSHERKLTKNYDTLKKERRDGERKERKKEKRKKERKMKEHENKINK